MLQQPPPGLPPIFRSFRKWLLLSPARKFRGMIALYSCAEIPRQSYPLPPTQPIPHRWPARQRMSFFMLGRGLCWHALYSRSGNAMKYIFRGRVMFLPLINEYNNERAYLCPCDIRPSPPSPVRQSPLYTQDFHRSPRIIILPEYHKESLGACSPTTTGRRSASQESPNWAEGGNRGISEKRIRGTWSSGNTEQVPVEIEVVAYLQFEDTYIITARFIATLYAEAGLLANLAKIYYTCRVWILNEVPLLPLPH